LWIPVLGEATEGKGNPYIYHAVLQYSTSFLTVRGRINRDGSTTNTTELGRTVLTMGKPASPVETLKIALMRTEPATSSATHGKLEIAWENVTASVPFTVK
jgi:hypothetical protein